MSVSLSPSAVIGFKRPLTQSSKQDLAVSNHNDHPVAFKVKTTAPKLYCVRPNSGRVDPGETVVVSVMLQSMKDEPPINAKCKDKFLIQSTVISGEKEALPLSELWTSLDGTEVHQHKIKVTYLPAESETVMEDENEGQNSTHLAPEDAADLSRYQTVRQAPANGRGAIPDITVAPVGEESIEREPEDFTAAHEEQPDESGISEVPIVNVNVHTPPAAPAPLPPIIAPATSQSDLELAAKYAEAQAEITRLRGLLAAVPAPGSGVELRRRTRGLAPSSIGATSDAGDSVTDYQTEVTSASGTGTMVEEPMAPEGVPLQAVIAIALGVFVVTYLFF